GPAGAYVCIQVKLNPQFAGGIVSALGTCRVARVRYRPQDDAIGRAARFQDGCRKRGALAFQARESDFVSFECEPQRETLVQKAKNVDRGRRNLRTDAISRKHDKMHNLPIISGLARRKRWKPRGTMLRERVLVAQSLLAVRVLQL